MARSAIINRFKLRDMSQSATFNGTTSKIDVANSSAINISGSVTVGCWVKIPRIAGGDFSVFMCKGSNEAYVLDYDQSGNRFRFIAQTTAGFSTRQGNTDTAILNSWVHLVGVFNSGTPGTILYINGALISSGGTSANTLVTNTNPLGIGYRSGSNDRFAPCKIDEPFVYSTALTQTQIQDIYYSGIYPTANLGWMSFLDGNSDDSSGNGNNGSDTAVTYTTDVFLKPRSAAANRVATSGRVAP